MKSLVLPTIVAVVLAAGAFRQTIEARDVLPSDVTWTPQYVLRDLGKTLRRTVSTGAQRINNSGLIAGYVDPANEEIGYVPSL